MRFYQGLLPAIQWDKEKGAPRCEFKHGVLDTDDEELINFLLDKGYLVQEDVEHLERGGRLDHGGFEPQPSLDDQLPSGRPPMDNPELAQGPTGNRPGMPLDNLPDSEQDEVNQQSKSVVVEDTAPVKKRVRKETAKPKVKKLKRGSKKK